VYMSKKQYNNARQALYEADDKYSSKEIYLELQKVEELLGVTNVSPTFAEQDINEDPYYKNLTNGLDVTVKFSPKRARGLFATRDFEQGELIFRELPFVSYSQTTHEHCFNCLKSLAPVMLACEDEEVERILRQLPKEQIEQMRNNILKGAGHEIEQKKIVCNRGSGLLFCSESCREIAWGNYGILLRHMVNKNPLLKVALPKQITDDNKPPEFISQHSIYLITLILARVSQTPNLWEDFITKHYYHLSKPERDLLKKEALQLEALRQLFPNLQDLLSPHNFVKLKTIVILNTYGLLLNQPSILLCLKSSHSDEEKELDAQWSVDEDIAIYGGAFLKLANLINHSCEANVTSPEHMYSNETTFVAQRPIKNGEELFCSYVLHDDKETRRELLYSNYKFWCNCPSCESGNRVL